MRRLLAVPLMCLLILPAVVQAQVGTPIASPTTGTSLDLAAMTLTPADLGTMGWNNVAAGASSLRDLQTEIDLLAYEPKTAPIQASLGDRLRAAGFRRHYTSILYQITVPLQTTAEGGYRFDRIVSTGVYEYETAAGAAAGFAATEDESFDPSLRDVPGSRPFGDRSEITRGGAADPSRPWINLTYQLGSLVADAWLYDYTVPEPDVATIELLADLLQHRIERIIGEGAPGLSNHVLRLQPTTGQIRWLYSVDRYSAIDGALIPSYGFLVSQLQTSATPPADSVASAPAIFTPPHYEYSAYVTADPWFEAPNPDEVAGITFFNSSLSAEGTADDASASLARLRGGFSAIPAPGVFGLAPAAPTFGDESFTAKLADRGVLASYIVARIGSTLAYLYVLTPDQPLAIPAIESLMTAQVACVQSTDTCAPLPMPEALM